MYIIVVGGGKVGYYLTKTLVHEGYEVLLIEKNPAKCETYTERFGAVVMNGDVAEASTLAAARAGRAAGM
ncbi:MAG: NAD-binding protein, partial [Thermomicrobiales bacterium]